MNDDHRLVVQEISPDPIGFSQPVTNRLKRMAHGISEGFLKSMDNGFHLPYTSGLLLYIQNADTGLDASPFTFSMGNVHSSTGSASMQLSEALLLSLDDREKTTHIVDALHKTLLKISNPNDALARQQLGEGYQHFLHEAFYYNSYPASKSPDEKYICHIQSKEKWGSSDHRLSVTDTLLNRTKTYFINSTTYTFYEELAGITEENKWDIILNTTRTFDPVYWEGKNFILHWGKDKYQFNRDKECIVRL